LRFNNSHLLTPLVRLMSTHLRVNVEAPEDTLQVHILDDDGVPAAGFDYADCGPVRGGHLEAPVAWQRSLDELRGKPVHIECELVNASLYGFYL